MLQKKSDAFWDVILGQLRLPLIVIGNALAFAGERYAVGAPSHWWLTGAGLVFMVVGLLIVIRHAYSPSAAKQEKSTAFVSLKWQVLLLSAWFAYLAYAKVLGAKAVPETWFAKILLGSWILLGVLGFFMGVGAEFARARNGRGEFAEPKRVQFAAENWLKVGMLSLIIACGWYVSVRKNKTWDLSYLRTTQFSDSTMQMIDSLTQDVEVAVFLPHGNEVLSKVKLYFDTLKSKPKIKLSYLDVEIDPISAEKFRVGRNGYVVFKSGDQTERFDLGLTISFARKTLKNLDSEVQKALLSVIEKKKVLYFTRGHGELNWSGSDESTPLKSAKLLETYLRTLNFSLRYFGVSEGSGQKVPDDADAVVVMGGDQPFLPEEVSAIKSYVDNGGKLFVLLDVDVPTQTSVSMGVRDVSKDPLLVWLKELGVEFKASVLANVANHLSATRSDADVWFLYSNVFTSHESVQNLAKNDQRAAVLTFRSGFFETKSNINRWSVYDTVKTLPDTFADENRNYKFDEGKEKKQSFVIGVVAEQKPGESAANQAGQSQDSHESGKRSKIVAFADATSLSDPLVRNQANLIYFVDSLRWLVGDVKSSGVAATEEDVRIRHTKKEDVTWFYGTILLVPGIVLVAGAIATRRARRTRN